ncbi:MAG TPA: Clp protease N-terminal domain-containing protein [Gaiellaceae bacterium]
MLELALRECVGLGHNHIGTEHILLGLVRENQGVGARVLLDYGTDADKVRDAVVHMLGGTAPRTYRSPPPPPRRRWSPVALVAVSWVLGAMTLGAGILIGWAIWG